MTESAVPPQDEFQAHVEAGELRFQCCEDCEARRWPPQSVCHACLSPRARWDRASEAATVLSYLVVNVGIIPGEPVPFTIVHVEFDDGVRFSAPLHGAAAPALSGRRVRWTTGLIDDRRTALLQLLDPAGPEPA